MSEDTTPPAPSPKSDITDRFSPPYNYEMFDGRVISFKRMLTENWSQLTSQLREERLRAENTKINKEIKEKDWEDRRYARMQAEQFIIENTRIRQVITYVSEDIDGIERLLRYSATAAGMSAEEWESIKDLIPQTQKVKISENIIYMPIVSPNSVGPAATRTSESTPGPETNEKSSSEPTSTGTTSSEKSSTTTPAET